MPTLLATCLLGLLHAATAETCGGLKSRYLASDCCGDEPSKPIDCITQQEIDDHLAMWGDALVAIGKAWREGSCSDARGAAISGIPDLYDLSDSSTILFKPTYTSGPDTFRADFNGTLSYFVGDCAEESYLSSDTGFALGAAPDVDRENWKGWTDAIFSNFRYLTGGAFCQAAVAQGKGRFPAYYDNGTTIGRVDKTFVFVRNNDGQIRLAAHHSSEVGY